MKFDKSSIQVGKTGNLYYKNGVLVEEKNETFWQLQFLYQSWLGWLIKPIVKRKIFSRIYGKWQSMTRSKSSIRPFIEKYNIDTSEFGRPVEQYTSFNDFFTRKLKPGARVIDMDWLHVTSPCDGKLLILPDITEQSQFLVKGKEFNLERFLRDKDLAKQYDRGVFMLFRLAPYDYHRYHFPCDAVALRPKEIKGVCESVNPLVYNLGLQPLISNERDIIMLNTKEFDTVVMVVIGAMFVSKIVHTYKPEVPVRKGDEVGYFQLGGSAVVLLFKKGVIVPRVDVVEHSQAGYETAVKMGEKIAERGKS